MDPYSGIRESFKPLEGCYFITFMYGASEKTLENTVINQHPLEWQKEANFRHPGQYVLTNWIEISKWDYEEYLKE